MASQQFDVSYTQSNDTSENGSITFKGTTKMASGRLDAVGDSVSAHGFAFQSPRGREFSVSVECTRRTKKMMDITVLFEELLDGSVYHGYSYAPAVIEKVIKGVSLDFR